jgi:hypothetical protein
LRRNNRAFGSHPYRRLPKAAPHPKTQKAPSDHPVGKGQISQIGYIKMISPEPTGVNKIVPIQEASIPTKVDPTKVATNTPHRCHSDARAKRDRRNPLQACGAQSGVPHFSRPLREVAVSSWGGYVYRIVRLINRVWLNDPETPVTVTVVVPNVAVAVALNVSELVAVAGFGLKPAVTPLPMPVADNVTLPVNPPEGVILIDVPPRDPCTMLTLVGDADSAKSALPVEFTVNVTVVVCIMPPPLPATVIV